MPPARTASRQAGPPRINPKAQFHFIHGDNEAAIENYKREIVATHLSPQEREENYREVGIGGAQAPHLSKVLGELIGELSTVSFLPDSKRVVTLYPVQDFLESRSRATGRKAKSAAAAPPKKTASEHLASFIEKELSNLPAVLIAIVIEDHEKWKRVAMTNPVVQAAANRGTLVSFKEQSAQFAFFDALFARNTGDAVRLWREWLDQTAGAPKPYNQLAAQLRLLVQAKTASSGQLQQRGISREKFRDEFLPRDFDKNLFLLKPEFRQEKLVRAAGNFTFAELLTAYEELEQLQKFAIPLGSDPYVPDKQLLAEMWIVSFTAGRD